MRLLYKTRVTNFLVCEIRKLSEKKRGGLREYPCPQMCWSVLTVMVYDKDNFVCKAQTGEALILCVGLGWNNIIFNC